MILIAEVNQSGAEALAKFDERTMATILNLVTQIERVFTSFYEYYETLSLENCLNNATERLLKQTKGLRNHFR